MWGEKAPPVHTDFRQSELYQQKECSMRTDFQHLLIQQDGGVLTITMNRPEVLNAINETLLAELAQAVEAAAQDETVRCVVLPRAGTPFASGQDLPCLSISRH